MGLAMDSLCQTCPQACKQYSGFGYDFKYSKCKLVSARNVLTQQIFDENELKNKLGEEWIR